MTFLKQVMSTSTNFFAQGGLRFFSSAACSARMQPKRSSSYEIVEKPSSIFQSLLLTSHSVQTKDLKALLDGRVSAIRIPKYCSPELAKEATRKLLSKGYEDYANAPGVGKITGLGMAFFEAVESPEQMKKYYEEIPKAFREIREVFHPQMPPIHKLILELNSKWPGKAGLLDLGHGPMFTGLVRVLTNEVLAHEDKLERDAKCTKKDLDYVTQLAVNIYLQVPAIGGEIHLWNKSTTSDAEYDALRGDSYGIKPERLGAPLLIIKPKVGDLIFFNPRNFHAVAASGKGEKPRVSYSSFIAYGGENKPLRFWS